MELTIQIKMNEKLFLRNPEETELGREIILHSIILIHKAGFESFTFKKLAEKIGTTEAGIYRYFENKHRLLIYIVSWYWSWLEYKVIVHTKNLMSPEKKLKKIIEILSTEVKDDVLTKHVDEQLLHEIVRMEGAKAYLTRHVTDDNKQQLFKPTKTFAQPLQQLFWNITQNINIHVPCQALLLKWHIPKFFLCTTSLH